MTQPVPSLANTSSVSLRPIDWAAIGCLGLTLLVWIFIDVATGRGHWSPGETYWLFESHLRWLNNPAVFDTVGFLPPVAGLVFGIVALARKRHGAAWWPGVLAMAFSPLVAIAGLLIGVATVIGRSG